MDDSGRILPRNQSSDWEDDNEDESEFSTYFTDQKVEIPTFPDDDKVSNKKCAICVCIESYQIASRRLNRNKIHCPRPRSHDISISVLSKTKKFFAVEMN